MIGFAASRRPASQEEVESALARLDDRQGIYFGVDAGVPQLHPLQATLLCQPALTLRLYGDGIEVEALTTLGRRLLAHEALRAWGTQVVRGPGCSAIDAVRRFMGAMAPSPDVLLVGALPFAAHRLAAPAGGSEALGLLFFAEGCFRRDAGGRWEEVVLRLESDDGPPSRSGAPQARPRSAASPPGVPAGALRDDLEPGGYAAMVRRALVHLRDRPLVSLTLSQCYRRRVELSPVAAFRRLREANPAPAVFFVNDGSGECLLGASPDLQLVVSGRTIHALPVCGTVTRQPGAVGEAESLRELLNEEVDAASLAVCTDALRNDLAPLCEPGSLNLLERRRPMSLATVVHTVDRLGGRLRPGKDAWDAIVATAAPVMVTGTPRQHALASIEELEPSPRGWYGGMVVQVASNGDALAGTILRAAAVRDGIAQVRTGGDLLADSVPEREEEESRLKTLSLWRAFAIDTAVAAAGPHATGPAVPGAVRLLLADDAFGAGVADCLAGLGVRIDQGAQLTVAAGFPGVGDMPQRNLVALGDAAARLLGREGFAIQSITPEQGRLVRCVATHDAPAGDSGPFVAARYLRWALASQDLQPGWVVWVRDATGSPQLLVHAQRQLACLLFRPESLLSQPPAREFLRRALIGCVGRL